MANRSGQYSAKEQRRVAVHLGARSSTIVWLEWLLPVFAAALLLAVFRPDYVPRVLTEPASSPLAWAAWGVIGALSGVVAFSGLLVIFFLVYSPIYLAGKMPMLVGKGGWADQREIRFYALCFLLLCVMLALTVVWLVTGDWRWLVSTFLALTGFAPIVWRAFV
jgi:hypothetical protein